MDYEKCKLCPRMCNVNRINGEKGFCGAPSTLKVAKAYLHKWEEPCLSSLNGSGTIFFSHCTLKCLFCQNYDISTKNFGIEISVERFSEICLELQEQGACNINLVTPSHYLPNIIEGLKLAKQNGLIIPIVYNSSGYERKEIIQELENIVDIYLPDFKYFDNTLANDFSHAKDYVENVIEAIAEMYRQQPNCIIENGTMKKGVIVRHLLLPNHINDSKKILKYLYDTYHNNIYISIMSQYTPLRKISKYPELNQKVSKSEYDKLLDYAIDLGIENAFIQENGADNESFIPIFDGSGVKS